MSRLPAQQIRFCTSRDGTRIAYATCGEGPPLLWATSWMHHLKLDWESPIWQPWLALLTRRHCLVRYDWRGCGLSDRDGIRFSPEQHIEDLEAVVGALGLRDFVLLGHEGSGTMCIAYAVRHPDLVSRLILCGCPTRGRFARSMSPKQVEEAETRIRVIEHGWSEEVPAFGQFLTALHMPDASAEQHRSFNDLIRATTSPENAVGVLRALYEADARELIPKVRCPTIVLHARKDSIIPFDEGRTIAALIPGARLVPLESRNHVLLENEPAWQQFVEELDDFLPKQPGVPANGAALPLDDLTTREREVLEFVAQGLDNNKIAKQLSISEKTVRNHVSTIFSKLGVNSRVHAVVRAREAGLGRK
jgi:pimeloyl-ACP methyl ester carboxylesterase/DNA-binding CsgD family transcriptional regulator